MDVLCKWSLLLGLLRCLVLLLLQLLLLELLRLELLSLVAHKSPTCRLLVLQREARHAAHSGHSSGLA